MNDAVFTAYEALEARMKMVDIIANNLANSQTTGFKRDFGQVLEEVTGTETNIEVYSLVDLAPGQLVATGNELDAAIDGPGFFVVDTDNGTRYTRNGSFSVNADGELVLKDGLRVLSDGNTPIFVGPGKVSIQDGGDVLSDGNVVATLRIVDFNDPKYLRKEGMFRFEWTGDAIDVADVLEPRVKSGHLEKSNVNSINEMVELMGAYREFESVAQTLRTISTEMDKQLLAELADLT